LLQRNQTLKQQILGTFFYMLYVVAMLQPVIPLIEYYSNKEYIASVLCENRDKPALACNGKCYLEKQLKKANTQDNHNHSAPQIDLSKYPVAPIYVVVEKNEIADRAQKTVTYIQFNHSQKYTSSVFKPPQVISYTNLTI